MGVVNLKWRVAMSLLGQNFTNEEQANGWPEVMKHGQLAALQYPYVKGDRAAIRLATARATDILTACNNGDLQHTATTVTVTPMPSSPQLPNRFASTEWLTRDGFISARPITRAPYDVTTHHIAAPAFAAWLVVQRETPSEHIAAWFDAVGIAGADVPDATVAETIQQRNARWLARLEAAKSGTNPPSDTAVYKQIEAAEGHKWDTVKRAVAKAKKDLAAKYKEGNVKPLVHGKKGAPELSKVWGNRIGK